MSWWGSGFDFFFFKVAQMVWLDMQPGLRPSHKKCWKKSQDFGQGDGIKLEF